MSLVYILHLVGAEDCALSDITDFLNHKAYAQTTILSYRLLLTRFLESFHDTERLNADQFRTWLDSQGWGDNHRWVAYCAVRAFIRWRYGDQHQALRLRIRRGETAPQRCLSADQASKLLESFDTSSQKGKRDLALCCLLLDTGIRASEACRLEMRYLDLDNCHLAVRVKGGKWGEASYSAYTRQTLISWLAVRQLIVRRGFRYVFCSIGGNKPGEALTRDGLKVIVRRWAEPAGLGELSPHDLRRSFATLAIRAGAPTRIVQVAGRWSSVEMVERYTRGIVMDDIKPYLPVSRVLGLDK